MKTKKLEVYSEEEEGQERWSLGGVSISDAPVYSPRLELSQSAGRAVVQQTFVSENMSQVHEGPWLNTGQKDHLKRAKNNLVK